MLAPNGCSALQVRDGDEAFKLVIGELVDQVLRPLCLRSGRECAVEQVGQDEFVAGAGSW